MLYSLIGFEFGCAQCGLRNAGVCAFAHPAGRRLRPMCRGVHKDRGIPAILDPMDRALAAAASGGILGGILEDRL
jgi:hypothetical protein